MNQVELRKAHRRVLLGEQVTRGERAALAHFFGFRIPRKRRTPSNPRLRKPSEREVTQAKRQLKNGMLAHEVESHWRQDGVRMSRNRLSKASGAR